MPIVALSLAAIRDRMTPARTADLLQVLQDEARNLQETSDLTGSLQG